MVDRKGLNIYTVNAIIITLVLIYNLFKGIVHGKDLVYYSLYVCIFAPVLLLNNIFRQKNKYKWNAFLYAFLGMGTIFGNEPGNYSGAVFILFSVYIFNTQKTNIILLIMTSVLIVAKNIFFGFEITNTVNLFLVYIYIFSIYYIMIHPKHPRMHNGFDETTNEILQYLIAGYDNKAISNKINLSVDAINKRIQRAREKLKVNNNEQMVYKIIQKGYISP